MLIKNIRKCEYFKAMDETMLCELLHPENENIEMGCSIAHAVLESGKASLPHKLKESVEVYYILEGRGLMHIERESEEVRPGQAVYIPPKNRQWIENIGKADLKFLCIVTPPWREDNEQLCK